MLTIDGEPTDPTAWKCKIVANMAAVDAEWLDKNFDDSRWRTGKVKVFTWVSVVIVECPIALVVTIEEAVLIIVVKTEVVATVQWQ